MKTDGAPPKPTITLVEGICAGVLLAVLIAAHAWAFLDPGSMAYAFGAYNPELPTKMFR